MPETNRQLSYSVNSLNFPLDDLVAGMNGTRARIGYLDPLPSVAQAAQSAYPQNVNYIVDGLTSDNSAPSTDANTPPQTPTQDSWFSFSSFFGTDPATVGKYSLLAVLAVALIIVGLFFLLEPVAKPIVKAVAAE